MKHLPILFIAFSSLVIAVPAFAQCRNGWCKAGCGSRDSSGCIYVRVISRDWPIIKVEENNIDGTKIVFFDCQQYKWKNESGSGKWYQMMPDSLGESVIETACRM